MLQWYNNYKTAYVNFGESIVPFSITAVKKYCTESEEQRSRKVVLPEIGDRIEELCPEDEKYYPETVKGLNQSNEKHHVVYDDGDVEHFYLSEVKWRALAKCVNHSVVVHKSWDVFQGMRKHSPYNVHEVIVRDPPDPRFTDSARDEIEDLLKRGSYVVVGKDEIPSDATVLKSGVQNSIKTKPDASENFKTRLVIQGHKDPEKIKV